MVRDEVNEVHFTRFIFVFFSLPQQEVEILTATQLTYPVHFSTLFARTEVVLRTLEVFPGLWTSLDGC